MGMCTEDQVEGDPLCRPALLSHYSPAAWRLGLIGRVMVWSAIWGFYGGSILVNALNISLGNEIKNKNMQRN